MTDPITTLRGKLQQLEAQHKGGAIGKKEYERARAAVERELLDRVLATPVAPTTVTAAQAPRPSGRLLATLTAVVLGVAVGGYWWTGAPSLVSGVPVAAAGADAKSPHDTSSEQMTALTERLAERMKSTPDDAEGWSMLGRSYAALGRTDEALRAYDRLIKLRPDDPSVLADYADALAVKNNQLAGEPMKYVERALKLDPNHVKALMLAGTDAFNRADYAKAVQHWERAAEAGPPDNPLVQMARSGVTEARARGNLPAPTASGKPPATTSTAQQPAGPATAAAAVVSGAISGTVTLAPALKGRVGPDDAIFVFARAATGSRMPVAFMRAQVKDLPLNFTLDDSMAMSPAARLSTAGQVVVGARVSKSGQAMPQAGDLEGLSEPTAAGSAGVNVVIAGEVK
jgi:cytochrome c-type biogenesis protein CcmH